MLVEEQLSAEVESLRTNQVLYTVFMQCGCMKAVSTLVVHVHHMTELHCKLKVSSVFSVKKDVLSYTFKYSRIKQMALNYSGIRSFLMQLRKSCKITEGTKKFIIMSKMNKQLNVDHVK